MSEALISKATVTAEAMKNYAKNRARTWYNDSVEADGRTGKYAFQRLGDTWFTPQIEPKL